MAASVLALALSTTPVVAAAPEACGAVVNGQVICGEGGAPYQDGIHYDILAPQPIQDLTIHLDDGVSVATTADDAAGISVFNDTGGAITISGTGSITTQGNHAAGVHAGTTEGDLTVEVGDVTTLGYRSDGIRAVSNYSNESGNVTVKAGTVITAGDVSDGIHAETSLSDIEITVDSITTSGYGSNGIYAAGNNGNTTLTVGSVTTSGTGGRAITALSYGETNITVGDVTTTGAGLGDYLTAGGIMAVGTKVNVDAGTVSTAGDFSVGIYARSNLVIADPNIADPSITITADTVTTSGDLSHGIVALNSAPFADSVINAGSVTTSGYNAFGLYSRANTGTAIINAGSVTTSGDYSGGIVGIGDGGNVAITVDSVITSGAQADGVYVVGSRSPFRTGTATVDAGTIATSGDQANGITAAAGYSDLALHADSVTTAGTGSYGVYSVIGGGAQSSGLKSHIDVGSVTTSGDDAIGILSGAFGTGHSIDIKVGTVNTTGTNAYGVYALAQGLNNTIAIDVGSVATSGNGSTGVSVKNFSTLGTTHITAADITVSGDFAAGIFAYSYVGNMTAEVQNVTTTGYADFGINLAARYGDVSVTADSITTSAGSAVGISTSGTNATVKVGSITTTGVGIDGSGSGGIIALAQNHASVTADTIITNGELAPGIFIFGETADVTVKSVTANGDFSVGILAQATSETGTVNVHADTVTVNGELGSGIDASGGTVNVTAGAVTTKGNGGMGIRANAYHDITVTGTGQISTLGVGASGITAFSLYGDIGISATKIITTGDYAAGILAYSLVGTVDIKTGAVTTSGTGAVGVYAVGTSGVTVAADAVTTSGDHATGIDVSTRSDTGSGISVTAVQVTTAGAGATGIKLGNIDNIASAGNLTRPRTAVATAIAPTDIKLTSGTVETTGEGAIGIDIVGLGNVAVTAGKTSSAGAEALHLQARGQVDLGLTGATTGGGEQTVHVEGADVNVTLASGATIAGPRHGLVIAANGAYAAPDLDSPALAAAGSGLATITNAGLIAGGDGFAVRVEAGTAKLTNTGRIDGAVAFSDGDDVFTNTGIFNASKDSAFGGGNDVFVNNGTVNILPGSVSGGMVTFLGLERFENTGGLLNLSNGHTGDRLTLPGTYMASGNARLGLDVSSTASDQLVVGGQATGKTTVMLTGLTPQTATLTGNSALKLIQVGAGSTATFDVGNAEIGLIHYGLKFDAATNSYSLSGSAGAAVYSNLRLVGSVQTLWSDSADAWSSHLAGQRGDVWGNGAPEEGKGNVWVEAYGTSSTRKADVDGVSTGYDQDNAGAQIGVDLNRGERLTWGITGGYAKSSLAFESVTHKADIASLNVGAYLGWRFGGSYFVNALTKYDHHQIKASDGAAIYQASLDGTSYGARAEIGRRFGSERLAFEPLASLSWVKASLDDLKVKGQSLAFDDSDGVTAKIGARISGKHQLKSGNAVVFTAGLSAVQALSGDTGLTFTSANLTQDLSAKTDGNYGQASLGVSYRTQSGVTTYIEGSSDFGGDNSGSALRIGARFKF